MQAGIILYLWILLRTFKLLPTLYRYASVAALRYKSLGSSHKRHEFSRKASERAKSLKEFFSNHDLVLKSMLVEFQEAQCFFMIACQAASLAANNNRSILSPTNMVMVWADEALSGMIGAAGIYPIVLGLWTLQKMHMCSPWIFFLSTVTLIISEVVTYFSATFPSIDELTPLGGGWPGSCGDHPPPLIYCGNPGFLVFASAVEVFLLMLNPICLTVYGIVLILWIRPYAKKILLSKKVLDSPSSFYVRVKRILSSEWLKWVDHILTTMIDLMNLGSAGMYVYCFSGMYKSGFISWGNWGFGQLIALTMWAPVFSKYFYWTICECTFCKAGVLRANVPCVF